MNWDAIGAIGEILGAAAVVASLAYLAIQIRLQNRESRVSTVIQQTEQWNALLANVAQSGEAAAIWARGLRGDAFEEGERVRFFAIASSLLHIHEGLYLQRLDGRLDDRLWVGFQGRMDDLLATPGLRAFWDVREHWFSREFRDYVTSRMTARVASDGTIYADEADQEDTS